MTDTMMCSYEGCSNDPVTALEINGEEKPVCQEHIQDLVRQHDTEKSSGVQKRYKISPLTLTLFKDDNDFHTLQLQRTYPVDEDASDFDYTNSLRPRDLRKAARLMQKAADDLQDLQVQKQ